MSAEIRNVALEPGEVARLAQEVAVLRKRLAVYEGFAPAIEEHVNIVREPLRIAAREQASTLREPDCAAVAASDRQRAQHLELATISGELEKLSGVIDGLVRRIAALLPELPATVANLDKPAHVNRSVSVVAHGVKSAQEALSLHAYVDSLPNVAEACVREFAGGLLRLDVRVCSALSVDQVRGWAPNVDIVAHAERPEVIEFSLGMMSR